MLSDFVHVEVIERPRLTAGPATATSVKEKTSVYFECHFNASMIPPRLALCRWLKDEDVASNGEKFQNFEAGFENHLKCNFTINSASAADEGNYSCFCCYNTSFKEQLHFDESITSQYGKAVLQLESIK